MRDLRNMMIGRVRLDPNYFLYDISPQEALEIYLEYMENEKSEWFRTRYQAYFSVLHILTDRDKPMNEVLPLPFDEKIEKVERVMSEEEKEFINNLIASSQPQKIR